MLERLSKTSKAALQCFNEITKPSAKHIQDKEEFEIDHNRNKTLLLICGSANLQFFINLLIGNGDIASNVQGIVGTSFISITLLITSHFSLHPQIFKTIYNLYVLAFGAAFIQNTTNGIIGAWLLAPILPILVYFLTGSIFHFLLHIAGQIAFLNTFYQRFMKETLVYIDIEDAIQTFTYFSNQNMAYALIYTAFIHYTIQRAAYKVKIAEQKKDDFEKQKNFLLGFSHELRNLLNSLMGNVKLASLENPSEKVKDLLLNAEVCAELLLHLVNNILDTGKVEIGELEINPVPTRVYDTMERIWSVCSELIKRKNLRGRFKIQKDIPQILVIDHYRLTQVFLNLVGNAIKYTDNGSVDISVEWIPSQEVVEDKCFEPLPFNDTNEQEEGIFEKTQAMSIFNNNFIILNLLKKKVDRNLLVSGTNKGKGVLKITISDTGCGIIQEDLGKLFQRFTQGTIDASKKKLGTGLGLFITKELCQKMNGEVKVFSRKGAGSTFTFCLPIEPITDDRAFTFDLEGIQRVVNQGQRPRAMVVDDEQFSRVILKDFLSKVNVDVFDVAENGLVAYEKFLERDSRKDWVNIITMDLNMPVMDGRQAIQKIREYEVLKKLKPCLLIVVSGNCDESTIRACLDPNGDMRADAFLKKPVSIDELCRVISCHFAQTYNQGRVRLLND